jgi:hypothetical protein
VNQLHHFYHIYADGAWERTVKYHISTLLTFGLHQHLSSLHIGLIGSVENRKKVKQYLLEKQVNYNICVEKESGFEQETLTSLLDFSKTNKGYVYYAHSKNSVNINWGLHEKYRLSMEGWTNREWRDCVEKLKDYSAVGVFYSNHPNLEGYFLFNYWWTDLRFIRSFSEPDFSSRFEATEWLSQLKSVVDFAGEDYKVYEFSPETLKNTIASL